MFHDSKEVTVGKNEIFNFSPGNKFNIETFWVVTCRFCRRAEKVFVHDVGIWCLRAPSTIKPEDCASISATSTTVMTANGSVDTNEKARVNVQGWDLFATAENTLSDVERCQC